MLALSEDGDAVGYLHNFVKFVRDDNNGLAVLFHLAQNRKQRLDLLRGQNGSGLIQDQNAGASVKYLDDFHRLFFRNGHCMDQFVRIYFKAVARSHFAHFGGNFLKGIKTVILYAKRDVLRGGKDVHQLKVLVHHAYFEGVSVFGAFDGDFFTIDEDLSFVGVINTRKHIHQGGLATAVLTEDG